MLSQKRQKTPGPTPRNFFSSFYLLKWRYIQLRFIRISILGAKNIKFEYKKSFKRHLFLYINLFSEI